MKHSIFALAVAVPVSAVLLLSAEPTSVAGLAVAVVAFFILWVLSLALRDASIVDIFWGASFVLMVWYYLLSSSGDPPLSAWLVCSLVTVWGLRLSAHIAVRNRGKGEDFRYAAWREESGPRFWWVSFFKVFLLQAVLLWIISSPLLLVNRPPTTKPATVAVWIGLAVWVVGFLFEAIADWQLARFKSDPGNQGTVMRSGLWSLSRHPNYFGEAVLWWGIALICFPAGGWLCFVGPALLTFLLVKVSGVAMLDDALVDRRPGYADYMRETPAFLPLGPNRSTSGRHHSSP